MLFGANTNPSQPPSTSTHSHLPRTPFQLSLAADNSTATILPPLCPPTDIDSATQSSNFLDLLDNGENSACSSKQWMPTPDRPRMFPRKLCGHGCFLASCVATDVSLQAVLKKFCEHCSTPSLTDNLGRFCEQISKITFMQLRVPAT